MYVVFLIDSKQIHTFDTKTALDVFIAGDVVYPKAKRIWETVGEFTAERSIEVTLTPVV